MGVAAVKANHLPRLIVRYTGTTLFTRFKG